MQLKQPLIVKKCPEDIVTLCAHAQQGYAFGRVRLYMYICIYVCQQKQAV